MRATDASTPALALRMAGVMLLSMTLLAAASPAASQDRPQFRTTVELVQLQVGVAGPDGEFVSGLTPEDFVVRIDGEERPVQVAYEVDLRDDREAPGSAAVTVAGAPEESRPVAARRHFLFLFDFSFTTSRGVLEARRAALRFLDGQVHEDDLLAVATYNRFGFRLLTPFTGSHDDARASVDSLGLAEARDVIGVAMEFEESIQEAILEAGDAELAQAISSANYREYVAQVSNYTEDLVTLGRTLQAIEGRKHVVLFSRGFDDRALTGQSLETLSAGAEARASSPAAVAGADPEQMYGPAEIRRSVEELIDEFRAADAVIHAIDPAGLTPARGGHQALTALADGTGGSVSWNMNDLSVALTRIEAATAAYYMIGYPKHADDPPTVKVRVQVRVPDVRVVSAPSVLSPPPGYERMTETQRQLQLAEVLADDRDRRDIPFEAQAVAFPRSAEAGKLAVVLEIPGLAIADLAGAGGEDRVRLEIAAFAIDTGGETVDVVRRGVTVDVAAMRRQGPMHEQMLRLYEYLDVSPGAYRLRVLVRDNRVGRLSSRTLAAHLPGPPPALHLSRPLLLAAGSAPARDELAPDFDPLALDGRPVLAEAAPVLAPGGRLRMLVVVYNLPRHPLSGEVAAGVVLEVEDMDGEPWPVRELEVIGTRHDDATGISQLVIDATIPERVPSGSMRIWTRLIDSLTGERVEEQTPVYVSGTTASR